MERMELLKKLKSMVAFQSVCLAEGNWEDFDHAEGIVENIEKQILAEEK